MHGKLRPIQEQDSFYCSDIFIMSGHKKCVVSEKMYYNITDRNNIDWMKAFHMVNVYRDRKVEFRMKLF